MSNKIKTDTDPAASSAVETIVIGLIDELQKEKEKTCQVCGDLDDTIWKECGCHVEGINEGLTIAISKLQKAL